MVNDLALELVQLPLESVAVLLLELEFLIFIGENYSFEVSRNLNNDHMSWGKSEIEAHFRSELCVDLRCWDLSVLLLIGFDLVIVLEEIVDIDLIYNLSFASHKAPIARLAARAEIQVVNFLIKVHIDGVFLTFHGE
jgi:hypothetical protein